jgi:diguanylate cyclase (GGDEF)-like protein/PAS domain S-box-containing protein
MGLWKKLDSDQQHFLEILLFTFFLSIFPFIFIIRTNPGTIKTTILFIVFLCNIFISAYLTIKNRLRFAQIGFITMIWVELTIIVIQNYPRPEHPIISCYLLLILLSGLIFNSKYGYIICLASCVLLIFLTLSEKIGITLPEPIEHSKNELLIIQLASLLMSAAILRIGLKQVQQIIKTQKQLNQTANEKTRELEEVRKYLEETIENRTAEIIAQKEFFEALTKNCPIAILTLDNQHRITSVNQAFEDLFLYKQEEVLGKNPDILIASIDSFQEAVGLTKEVVSGGTIRSISKRTNKNGEKIDVEVFGVPVNVADEQIGILAMYNDIRSIKMAEDQLRWESLINRTLTELSNSLQTPAISSKNVINHALEYGLAITGSQYGFSCFINRAYTELKRNRTFWDIKQSQVIHSETQNIRFSPESWTTDNVAHQSFFSNDPTPSELNALHVDPSLDIHNILAVPALIGKDVVGQIVLANSDHELTLRDVEAIKRLADINAITLQRTLINEALRESESRFRKLFEQSNDAVFIHNRYGKILDANQSACKMLGFSKFELLNTNLEKHTPFSNKTMLQWGIDQAIETGSTRFDSLLIKKNGTLINVEMSACVVDEDDQKIQSIIRDITERQMTLMRLEHAATHDSLTGLPNRSLLYDRVEHAIEIARRQDYKLAVAFIDLDGFKHINDTFGHAKGDLFLKEFAARLKSITRISDTVARLAGDEFTILLENITSSTDIIPIIDKIVNELEAPFTINQSSIKITASIGISIFPDDAIKTESLIKCADTAMYRQKRIGKNGYQFYSETAKMKDLA